MERYLRQTTLPIVGEDGQQKLLNGSALIIGAGGLGVPASLYLAGAGVGRIGILDDDTICLTNLHRQVIYKEKDIGTPKAKKLARHLKQLNADVEVNYYLQRLISSNASDLIAQYDVVIDAADNFITTYVLNDICQEKNKPLVSASVIGCKGYVGVFGSQSPSYRAVFPELPEEAKTCSEAGVLAPVAGIMGMMQAQETIKILLNAKTVLYGRLQIIDIWENRFSSIDFSDAEELVDYTPVALISKDELCPNDTLIDVRSAAEFEQRPAANAINIPVDELLLHLEKVDFNTRLVFVCASGKRATRAAFLLTKKYSCEIAVMHNSQ